MESATAGAIAGVLSMTLTYPLDQIRTRLQAGESSNSILIALRKEGAGSLLHGLRAVLETVAVSNFVYFFFIEKLRDRKLFHSLGSDFQNISVSTISGCLNVLFTEPLWKANTRLRLRAPQKNDRSVFSELFEAVNSQGVAAQWSGTQASLLLVANPVIQFFVYENLKRKFTRKILTSGQAFALGALAKAVATVLTYPLQVAQTRQRVESEISGKFRTISVLLKIFKAEGVAGIFRGLGAKLSQTVLTAAFMFLFYERIRAMTNKLLR